MNISHWIFSTLSILIAAYLIPGVATTILGAIIFAVVLGVINMFIKPIITILTLPITIITLGLFSLVINAVLIMLASQIVPEFYVSGFWAAFFFSIIVSLINALFISKKSEEKISK
jgi:putative membrane protein